MNAKELVSLITDLRNDPLFSSRTSHLCVSLYNTLGVSLKMALGRNLPAPYQALIDSANLDSVGATMASLSTQLQVADRLCVAFGMYDAHDRFKATIQDMPSDKGAIEPWHSQLIFVLNNVLTTQPRTSNTDKYQKAFDALLAETSTVAEIHESVKSLRFTEFHQRQDGEVDQWPDFLGLLAQAGLVDALHLLSK